jgi:hypothetical protein
MFANACSQLLGADRQDIRHIRRHARSQRYQLATSTMSEEFSKPARKRAPLRQKKREGADRVAEGRSKGLSWDPGRRIGFHSKANTIVSSVAFSASDSCSKLRPRQAHYFRGKDKVTARRFSLEENYADRRSLSVSEAREKRALPLQAMRIGDLAIGWCAWRSFR